MWRKNFLAWILHTHFICLFLTAKSVEYLILLFFTFLRKMTWLSTVRPPHVYLVCTKYWTYGIVLYIYKLTSQFDRLPITLLEKQSKFPRYNTKSRIFCAVSRCPHHISCYIAESRLPLGQCSLDMKVQFVRWGGKCVELLHRAGHAQK